MKTFKAYVENRLVEDDEMYTDKDVIDSMPREIQAQMAQITDKNAYAKIIAQVKQTLNKAYQAYISRQGPLPNVAAIWLSVAGGGQQAGGQQAIQPQRKVAKVLDVQRSVGTMSDADIDNEIKSYLGNSESGLVKNLDKQVAKEIEYKLVNGQLRPRIVANASDGRRNGTGIWFYKSPHGLAFIRILPGARAFSRPFGTY